MNPYLSSHMGITAEQHRSKIGIWNLSGAKYSRNRPDRCDREEFHVPTYKKTYTMGGPPLMKPSQKLSALVLTLFILSSISGKIINEIMHWSESNMIFFLFSKLILV